MRVSTLPLNAAVWRLHFNQRYIHGIVYGRGIHLSATPATTSESHDNLFAEVSADSADARFEVIGAPYSILSVSLSASQQLYTRRDTLIGISGNPENTRSALFSFEPIRRGFLGMPFLHHRISSTTNTTVLISTKSPINSFAVLNLNGTVDWVIAQRNALLAWTGHSLSLSARVGRGFGFARWGNTKVTGRGLIAMTGSGTIFQVRLQVGEKFVVNPSNVVAYTLTQQLPEPYRFPSVRYDLKQPWMSRLADLMVKFGPTRDLLKTGLWHRATQLFNTILKWSRQAVFGNELFMKFSGPATILISSRTAQLSDRRSLKDARPVGTETHVAKPSGPHL
ncbi:unnamed protein product [Blumeria hordei]|uniref:Altered inheritance of mitochondria protein 24, mitochondrial n=2 Tax=Blumeria hordei TaxID=2867405 RepID=A0A383UPQ2_BLUHO|nr:unnamed protein product [Blumeria hordei]